jgi:LPS sulfotransferase NodH
MPAKKAGSRTDKTVVKQTDRQTDKPEKTTVPPDRQTDKTAPERPVVSAAERPVVSAAERPVVSAAERPVVSAAERLPPAPITYFIESIPLNGSNYLFDLLTLNRLGVAARDRRNFFIGYGAGVRDVYPARVREVIEKNRDEHGIAGLLTNWVYLDHLDSLLESDLPVDLMGFFTHHFRILRGDTLTQATEWAIAQQTGVYSIEDAWRVENSAKEPRYDRSQITANLAVIEREEARWTALYTDLGIKPFVVRFDDLQHEPNSVVQGAYGYFGLGSLKAPAQPHEGLLIDARTAEFVQRYESGEG